MKRIILIEDNDSLGATLQERLGKEGYQVTWARTLRESREKIIGQQFDLAIVDLGLPDGTGFDFAKVLAKTAALPVVFLTATSSAENRLKGFELGAADFIPKPFHLKELLLRIEKVIQNSTSSKRISCAEFSLDSGSLGIVFSDGRTEYLQPRDFSLLRLLVESAPKVISREEILELIWKDERSPSQRSVDNSVVRIRQLLPPESAKALRAVRGVGYQWVSS